jgi:hypothetical protein
MDEQEGTTSLLVDYYREHDVARELKKHPRTIKRWRDLGIGPPYTLLGVEVRYPVAKVKAWIAAGGTPRGSVRRAGKVTA